MFLIKKTEDDKQIICYYGDTNNIEDMGLILYDKVAECFSKIKTEKEGTRYVFDASARKLTGFIMDNQEIPKEIYWVTH